MEEKFKASLKDRRGTKKLDIKRISIMSIPVRNNFHKNQRKLVKGSEIRKKEKKNEKMEFLLIRIKRSQEKRVRINENF